MKLSQSLLVLPLILGITACATMPQNQGVKPEEKATIKSSHLILNTTQREIVMKHNNMFSDNLPDPYAPMDSGAIVQHVAAYNPPNLLSDMVVAGMQHSGAKKAVTAMSSVHDALGSFDYLQLFNSQLKEKVATIPWLQVKNQEVRYNIKEREQDIVANNPENATLLIGTTYSLNSTFKQLEVVAYVELLEKVPGQAKPKTLYSNNFYFIDRLNNPTSDKLANKEQWTRENAKMLKRKLGLAANLLSSMIGSQLRNTNTLPSTSNIVKIQDVNGAKSKGNLIKKSMDYSIVSLASSDSRNGTLYAVSPSLIVTG